MSSTLELELTELLAEANAHLKSVKAKVSLVRRGQRLLWQATLPPKPNSTRNRPYQQQINSGYPYSKAGIRKAKAKAITLGAELVAGEFDWSNYVTSRVEVATGAEWIAKFEKVYRAKNSLKDSTWANDWLKWFKRLPTDKVLKRDHFVEAVLSTPQNSASRKYCCTKLQRLADFAQIKVDLKQYQGEYGRGRVKHRELPSDAVIQEWIGQIPNAGWRRVTG